MCIIVTSILLRWPEIRRGPSGGGKLNELPKHVKGMFNLDYEWQNDVYPWLEPRSSCFTLVS